ncbi:MAG TPA: c-type cytochrome [Longimicrobiales bacterium]|nr:c-type cytochrome [Longimicrobiales bacterium]
MRIAALLAGIVFLFAPACDGGAEPDATASGQRGSSAGQGGSTGGGGAGGASSRPTDTESAQQGPPAGASLLDVAVTTLTPVGPGGDSAITNPFVNDENAIAEGEIFFNHFNCSGCHAPLGGGGMGPPLSDTLWIYGGAPANVYLSIVQGRPNGMPAWHELPDEVVWKIVAYIHTLPERASRISSAPRRP